MMMLCCKHWRLILLLVAVLATGCAAGGKGGAGRRHHRKGSHGQSGFRCVVCQAVASEAQLTWANAKTTKSGSPYHYIGLEDRGKAPEEIVLKRVQETVCKRSFLSGLPNPNGYAMHMPTLTYECDNLVEEQGESMVDALGLGENLKTFCWDSDICGSHDDVHFGFGTAGQEL
mmetsp:Transcript_62731/g.149666  ORF Transcript_62731/g.149666 Transcript_62731/m.149666 type:complete len:173 (+) Transcript_62731:110-628(+)